MPRVYRHPDLIEERSSPESSDVDDEIVLSDLVRTGEASRLRRRGAMRIDHAARESGGPPPLQPPENHPSGRSTQATELAPNANAIWRQDQDGAADEDDSPGSYTGEWPEARDTQAEDLDYPEDLEKSAQTFVLYCGAEEPHLTSSITPHLISPLPSYPRRPPSPPTHPTSNGCGAVIHMSAVPRKRCGVWMARFGSTDAVTELDSQYFDRSVVARMMKSPCGCIREGIGCRFCGNLLGTRYRPCKAAAEGLFSTATTPSHPNCPSGSAYWRNPPSPSLSSSTPFIYTLFPNHVSSFPPLDLTLTSSPANVQFTARTASQQQAGSQPSTSSTTTSQSRPGSEFDADGNPIGDSTNSPDKGIEAWSGR
ncbi:hypothetical protein BJ322DRAFT_1129764 [Thelephora terrestris]|uniref:Uncharacterized protein n=1 Tax=Thelephora terrestris TaxID=56493 RepID=A0A9P6H7P6_9AGAM|nr:hypothetical protein BJ322DRAFT_1129764 [Thelephora terrestris]